MQPLPLRAWIKTDNTIVKIDGFEFDYHSINLKINNEWMFFSKELVKVLSCSGISDRKGNLLYEGDTVHLIIDADNSSKAKQVKGNIFFRNSAFFFETPKIIQPLYTIRPSDIEWLGNFYLDPVGDHALVK